MEVSHRKSPLSLWIVAGGAALAAPVLFYLSKRLYDQHWHAAPSVAEIPAPKQTTWVRAVEMVAVFRLLPCAVVSVSLRMPCNALRR